MRRAWFAFGLVVGSASTYMVLTLFTPPPPTRVAVVSTATPQTAPVAPPALPPAVLPPPTEASPPAAPAEASAAAAATTPFAPPEPFPRSPEPLFWPSRTPPAESRSVALPLLETDLDRLRARALLIPVQGLEQSSVHDTFGDGRNGGRRHQAIDLLAPRGTPVLAADDGRIERLFTSRLGGLTIYQFDRVGEYCYYYAHLDRYAEGLVEGMAVRKGDVIGSVGTTGNAPPGTPHLHFAIFRLGPAKRWWEGTAINAYPLWGKQAGS